MHEHNDWPNFTFDPSLLVSKLAGVRHRQGRLLGRMEGLGFALKREASLATLTDDVVKSSAIEGVKLDAEEVRSSIASRLGIDIAGSVPTSRNVEGIVEMMQNATQQFDQDLTNERLSNWHAALFQTERSGMHRVTVGGWRTMDVELMQVVSGPADVKKSILKPRLRTGSKRKWLPSSCGLRATTASIQSSGLVWHILWFL